MLLTERQSCYLVFCLLCSVCSKATVIELVMVHACMCVCRGAVFCNRCIILLPAVIPGWSAHCLALYTWTSNWVVNSCKQLSHNMNYCFVLLHCTGTAVWFCTMGSYWYFCCSSDWLAAHTFNTGYRRGIIHERQCDLCPGRRVTDRIACGLCCSSGVWVVTRTRDVKQSLTQTWIQESFIQYQDSVYQRPR